MVYNSLSDPSLNLWVLVPGEIPIEIPETVPAASSHIELDTSGITDGYVSVTRDTENFDVFKINGNRLFIPLSAEDTGDIMMTVSAKNHLPLQQIIEVQPATGAALISYDFNESRLMPGERVVMNFTVKNFSDSPLTDVSAQLTNLNDDYVEMITDQSDIGNLAANQTAAGSFIFEIESFVPRHTPLQFVLDVSPSENSAKIQTIVGGIMLTVQEVNVITANDILDPGQTASIRLLISNDGEADAVNLRANVIPGSNAVAVSGNPLDFGSIAVGETGEAFFTATAAIDAYVGRIVHFLLVFEDERGLQATSNFNIIIGDVNNTAPTGPCPYGYFAYDSFDTSYNHHPAYNWVDIENVGDVIKLADDETISMDLPFDFGYYGSSYNTVNICSNGWISFADRTSLSFRNYSIPSFINPSGIIAPFWDDLKGLPEAGDSIRIVTYYGQHPNRFIISWLDACNYAEVSPAGLEKFQIILEPGDSGDGDIIFQYHTVWNLNQSRLYSTTGIQSVCNTMGLQYAFNNSYPLSATPLQNNLAIRFTTEPPDSYTFVDDLTEPLLSAKLEQNYPNPFNPETVIEFNLPQQGWTELVVYNIIGQKVRTLTAGVLPAGKHHYVWDGRDHHNREVTSGVYLYKLRHQETVKVKRMILLK